MRRAVGRLTRWALGAAVAGLAAACVSEPGPGQPGAETKTHFYHPDRRDYATFALAHPDLPEPNYLPFMVHRFARPGGLGDVLVLCHFDREQMPIPVYIERPVYERGVEDEFRPVDPEVFVEAAARALAEWEKSLDGVVDFERVSDPALARLHIRLHGGPGEWDGPGFVELGNAEALADACRVTGWDPDAERLLVGFEMPEIVIHVADEAGLLTSAQVRRIAIHELGHALGMWGHSPSPGDVMYPLYDDRARAEELSIQDVNSFVALYAVPNGAHFVDPPWESRRPPRPPPLPPSGGPHVDRTPYVDARHGFEIRVPSRWVRTEEPNGAFFSDGPTWDHDASLRIFVWPAPTIEAFRRCCEQPLLSDTFFRRARDERVNGRRALRLEVEDEAGELARELLVVELGDGRSMLIASESPVGYEKAWRPWFEASLATLEIWFDSRRERLFGEVAGGKVAP